MAISSKASQSSLGRWLSADPIGFAGSLNTYSYVDNNPINAVDPEGLEGIPFGYRWGGPYGMEPIPGYDWAQDSRDFKANCDTAADAATMLLWELGIRAALRGGSRSSGPAPSPFNAARRGDSVHYDKYNGRPGTESGPSAFQRKYPQTQAQHTPQGAKGVDLRVTGGKHPSTYPGSNWPPKANTADFKPGNKGGYDAFRRESKSGKIPPNTVMMPYNPETLEPYIP